MKTGLVFLLLFLAGCAGDKSPDPIGLEGNKLGEWHFISQAGEQVLIEMVYIITTDPPQIASSEYPAREDSWDIEPAIMVQDNLFTLKRDYLDSDFSNYSEMGYDSEAKYRDDIIDFFYIENGNLTIASGKQRALNGEMSTINKIERID